MYTKTLFSYGLWQKTSDWINFTRIDCPFTKHSETVCRTEDRKTNAIWIDIYAEGDHARLVFAEHSALGDPAGWGGPAGSWRRIAMEWRIDNTGVHKTGPISVSRYN